MKADMAVGTGFRNFGIKPDIAAFHSVEKFAVEDDAGVGEYGPQWQGLTPARMRQNDIRNEVRRRQRRQRIEHLFRTMTLEIKASGKRVARRNIDTVQAVFHKLYARNLARRHA